MEDSFVPIKSNLQRLMVHAFSNGGITYKDQSVYDSSRFYKGVSFLKRNGYIRPVCSVCQRKLKTDENGLCDKRDRQHSLGNHLVRRYNLTLKGEALVLLIRGTH